MDKLKLNFEIIPTGAFNFNLRSQFSKKAWDIIRKDAYQRADGKCSICNSPSIRLEAHEVWEFNKEKKIQKLKDVIGICHKCHTVIHINRAHLTNEIDVAIAHFKRVNNVDYQGYVKALKDANEKNIELSKIYDWSLDLSYLEKFIKD